MIVFWWRTLEQSSDSGCHRVICKQMKWLNLTSSRSMIWHQLWRSSICGWWTFSSKVNPLIPNSTFSLHRIPWKSFRNDAAKNSKSSNFITSIVVALQPSHGLLSSVSLQRNAGYFWIMLSRHVETSSNARYGTSSTLQPGSNASPEAMQSFDLD